MKNFFNPTNKAYDWGSEGFLLAYLSNYQIIHSGDIKNYMNELVEQGTTDTNNIYFILSRSKVTIDPDSFRMNGGEAYFNLDTWQKEDRARFEAVLQFPHFKGEVSLQTKYPFTKFSLIDSEGNSITSRPTHLIDKIEEGLEPIKALLDYEVIYIGQAYGKDGNRSAVDRLVNHETLQEVLVDCIDNYPDREVFILLASFNYKDILMSLPYENYGNNFNEELEKTYFENKGFKISPKQRLNVTEGMLIKYFSPYYNEKFKDIFPSKAHTSYSELYDLNIKAIGLELCMDNIIYNLYSSKAESTNYHMAKFVLQEEGNRFNIFEIE